MHHGKTTRGIAIVTAVWVGAIGAAFALTVTGDDVALAQKGCRGGGSSPSPSRSPSPSASGGGGPIPSIPPSIPPNPIPDTKKAPGPAGLDPWEKVPVAAEQGTTCKSTITISYSGRAFKGKVDSGEPMCKRARRVQIKKIKDGKDPTVARAVTNARGAYTAPEPNARGRFYAQVAKSTTENDDGDRVTCQAARSKAIRP
ncbi:MAG: hypothetical protein M3217_09220 [Actinomycetota bacterium]|nr:hypothetical protein [Actinomycetota bacterium]